VASTWIGSTIVFVAIFLLLYMVFHAITEALVLIFPTFYAMTGGLILTFPDEVIAGFAVQRAIENWILRNPGYQE
jgi:Cu/Ag efflux pump CusA